MESTAPCQVKPVFRKPVPDGVVEVAGMTSSEASAIVELRDARLMLVSGPAYRTSGDGGCSWSDSEPLAYPGCARHQGLSCLRLRSGALCLAYNDEETGWCAATSDDDGTTWARQGAVNLLGSPYYDSLIQLESGRLLLPSRTCYGNGRHPGMSYEEASSWGTWNGLPLQVAGHYHSPEIDIAAVSFSDDDGKTWQRGEGELMGWFDADGVANGQGGVTACDEPNVAATADGRVMFLARSTVGRLVACHSDDGGETWTAVRPTELASSYSPARLRRIPQTGDLLCIWNQVSREEIRRGYRRGRLSAAVSGDGGLSWANFKTIEVSAGIEDVDRIPAERPITPVVALPDVGRLPRDFATFDYANVRFAGDKVLVMYSRSWVEAAPDADTATTLGERHGHAVKPGEAVLRIYPLEWFYS